MPEIETAARRHQSHYKRAQRIESEEKKNGNESILNKIGGKISLNFFVLRTCARFAKCEDLSHDVMER